MRIKEIESNSEIPPVNYKAFTNKPYLHILAFDSTLHRTASVLKAACALCIISSACNQSRREMNVWNLVTNLNFLT